MKKLEGKVAIITGGAQGLGFEMVNLFSTEGATVIAVDIKDFKLDIPNVESYQLDVTNGKDCEKFFNYVKEKYNKIDILVNNAGITRDALTHKMSEEMWDLVIDVNLKGVFNLTKFVGLDMMYAGQGSIINISSVVGEYGNIGQANYSATKAGLIGLTKTWAKEYARKGANVRVNAVSPGYIMTDMLKTIPEELLAKFAKLTMLKRLGEPIEIAKAALFLASDDSSYITGHTLSVNGGMRL